MSRREAGTTHLRAPANLSGQMRGLSSRLSGKAKRTSLGPDHRCATTFARHEVPCPAKKNVRPAYAQDPVYASHLAAIGISVVFLSGNYGGPGDTRVHAD